MSDTTLPVPVPAGFLEITHEVTKLKARVAELLAERPLDTRQLALATELQRQLLFVGILAATLDANLRPGALH